MMVVFLGPDGSGKSSVIEMLRQFYESQGLSVEVFHLHFPLFQKCFKRPPRVVTDPHVQSNYSLFLSVAKLIYFWLIYNLGFLVNWGSVFNNRKLLIVDRYFHDLLVDPRRYRYGGPLWLARTVSFLIPRPQQLILLDAPAEVLQTRKQEVPFEETDRQRHAYLALAKSLPYATVVNASRPLEKVSEDVVATLARHFKRTVV